jgi:low affinity Fe/Cu permease
MGLFDRFAERASHFTSRAWFFGFCVLLVALWVPSLPLFGNVDTWQLVINTATTIITFLLVALLQNSQWRGDRATNQKLDAVAGGLADTMDAVDLILDALTIHTDRHEMDEAADRLRQSVGLEERMSSSGRDTGQRGRGGTGAQPAVQPEAAS